jgi:2-polyprenyl-3-methyl-5-hydroxy-6-metoxy-1,4-benzoquinol methylase
MTVSVLSGSRVADRAMFSQPQLLDFWRGVIDPDHLGMPEAIAGDIAAFTREPRAQVLQQMARGTKALKELWESHRIDISSPDQVERFYRDQFVEAYELANWHCGRTNGVPPLNYAHAALLARERGLARVLDFGSGIGSGSLALASVGCEVHSADIADRLLDFVEYRMRVRGFVPTTIRLSRGETPRMDYYDLITCFDVLEHIPAQLNKLRELENYLRYGGVLLVNLMEDSTHPDRPMHVSSAGNRLRLIRKTGLQPDWSTFGEMQALTRTRLAGARNVVAALIDRVQGA